MSLRSLSLCIVLLRFHPIFSPRVLAASDVPGTIKLYDDYGCNHPSTLNPTVTLSLSTCLVTTGGEGLVIAETPPCPQSTATLLYYQDTACGVPTSYVSTNSFAQNCWQLADGTDLYNARSVMFTCQPGNNPQPSSTTTAIVSALAAVATGPPGSSGSSSSASAAGSTPTTDTNTQRGSTGSSNGSTSNGTTSNGGANTSTTTSTGSSSGLDTGSIIALAVGLGVGITTIVLMLAAWLFPDFRFKLKKWIRAALNHSAFPRNDGPQMQQQQQQQHQPPYYY